MEPLLTDTCDLSRRDFDVAIVGAGPVGLALAIGLARLELSVLVLDRRPPLDRDARARPQLLVARLGDLANLAELGVDVRDESLVSMLAIRTERDLASGTVISGEVRELPRWLSRTPDLRALAGQPPIALVPIARLQQALLARALEHGVDVCYGHDVTRLRRHARYVSLATARGASARAALAVVATGAARPLIASLLRSQLPAAIDGRRLVAGVFDVGGDRGRWLRVEVPVRDQAPMRCTLLQTPALSRAGTALLVDPQLDGVASPEQLQGCFVTTARTLGLTGAAYLVEPQVFDSTVTELPRRIVHGGNRAAVVIAGDAAQTGHVFSGQTCFINIALALELCTALSGATSAIVGRDVNAPALQRALLRYAQASETGAAILARASQRHLTRHAPGAWALAGIATAT